MPRIQENYAIAKWSTELLPPPPSTYWLINISGDGKVIMSSTHGRHGAEKCLDRDEDTFCHNKGLVKTGLEISDKLVFITE